VKGLRVTVADNHMTASTNRLRRGRNDAGVGHLDGSIGHEAGTEDNNHRPYPRLTSAYREGKDSAVAVNDAWERSSRICPKVETASSRILGEEGYQRVAVHDLAAGLDRTKVRTNRL
jgi:hypothetical protein